MTWYWILLVAAGGAAIGVIGTVLYLWHSWKDMNW